MTKKEFIWLGIRVIGIHWLLILLLHGFQLTSVTGYWCLSKIRNPDVGGFFLTWISHLTSFPVPILLAVYFLFFGKLFYKLIDRCARSQPGDLTKQTGYCYCEIIVRFFGLHFVYTMCSFSIVLPLRTHFHLALRAVFTQPETTFGDAFATTFKFWLSPEALFSLALCLVFGFLFAWYFLKHGKFFINLLNRLWLGKDTEDLNQNPVDPV